MEKKQARAADGAGLFVLVGGIRVNVLTNLSRHIDVANEWIGRFTAWFALIMVLMQFAVVLLRYVFGVGFIPMQESILFMHSMLFLVATGYTLLHDGHVRVDIFYGSATPRNKALINLIGVVVFLWPLCIVMLYTSWSFVFAALRVWEGSPEGTFMPFWLLKSMLLAFPILLALQGLSMAVNSYLIYTGAKAPPGPPPATVEESEGHGI